MLTRLQSRRTADTFPLLDLGDDLLGLVLAATGATLPQPLPPISWWLEDEHLFYPRNIWAGTRVCIQLSCKKLKAVFAACNTAQTVHVARDVGLIQTGSTAAPSLPIALVGRIPRLSSLRVTFELLEACSETPTEPVTAAPLETSEDMPAIIGAMRDPSTLRELHIKGDLSGPPFLSLSSLSTCVGLVMITIDGDLTPRDGWGTAGVDLSPLVSCHSLRRLHVMEVKSLTASCLGSLGELRLGSLEELNLSGCCSGREGDKLLPLIGTQGTQLRRLCLSGTRVFDLSPLSTMTALEYLDLHSNPTNDLSPLSACTGLQALNIDDTDASDLRPLCRLVRLQRLSCQGTIVADLRPLTGLSLLQHLSCSSTRVSSLRPLSRLTSLAWLNFGCTYVSDLSPLSELTCLERLECFYCYRVVDLRPLAGLLNLRDLDLGGNTGVKATALRHLAACTNFRNLRLGSTKVKSLPACLRAGNPSLAEIGPQVWGRGGEENNGL